MSIARVTEIISRSEISFDDAISNGIKRACKTLDNVQGAWVKDQNISITNGKASAYVVTLKITFVLKD
jgi:flavin-binding protein dodecin